MFLQFKYRSNPSPLGGLSGFLLKRSMKQITEELSPRWRRVGRIYAEGDPLKS